MAAFSALLEIGLCVVRSRRKNLCLEEEKMPTITAYCYLLSLLFYVMGSLKTRAIENVISGHLTHYNLTLNISLATGYFVLTIFLAVVGSYFLYLEYRLAQKRRRYSKLRFQVKMDKTPHTIRRAS